ncbi:hypothetical protein C1949_18770 [Halopseudomonas oceani]|uniref:Uncharacterized protein n=2 Tax=Halopseudomonas oceani TaxID=1708783 RepID=A0A2P4EQE2_9GAMM|nr:hypothetical protein C1949_18770 [Halopseudomonas oceani]
MKNAEFDKSIYYVDWTHKTGAEFQKNMTAMNQRINQLFFQHPKILKYISEHDVAKYEGNLAWDVLGQSEYVRILQQAQKEIPIKSEKLEYEARINLHDV